MKKPTYKNLKTLLAFLLFLNLILIIFYFIFLKKWVIEAYNGTAPNWFVEILNYVYPRFFTEKYRFDLDFFLDKSQSVIWRFTLVNLTLIAFLYFYYYSEKFKHKVYTFWNRETSKQNVRILIKLYTILGIWFTWDWIWTLLQFHKFKAFYEPVFLLKILHLPFPNEAILWILYSVMLLSLVLMFFEIKLVWTSSVFAVLFVILQGYLFSFHKLDHTFAPFMYAICIMPFLVYNSVKVSNFDRVENNAKINAWALILIQVCISLTYFFAGVEKVLVGGLEWFYPQTLAIYLTTHQADWGLWLAQFPLLCSFLAIATVVFELAFPIILFYKRLTLLILFSGFLFHLGTVLFLNVGGFPSPWVLTYVFFVNWDKIGFYFASKSK